MALALLLPLLAGVGMTNRSGVPAQEPVTLDLWIFEGEEDLLPALEEAFEAAHPNINVEITLIPEDQYVVKIDTALAAGSPPDIGYLYDRRWVKLGKILPLDETIATHEIDLADLNQAIIGGTCMIDGQVYCLGSYTGAVALLYNKAMFDAAGLAYPSATEPMTVDEYAELAAQLSPPTTTSCNGSGAPAPEYPIGGCTAPTCSARMGGRRSVTSTTSRPSTPIRCWPTWSSRVIHRVRSVMQALGTETSEDLFLQGQLAMVIGDFADITSPGGGRCRLRRGDAAGRASRRPTLSTDVDRRLRRLQRQRPSGRGRGVRRLPRHRGATPAGRSDRPAAAERAARPRSTTGPGKGTPRAANSSCR